MKDILSLVLVLLTLPFAGLVIISLTAYYFLSGKNKTRLSVQKFSLT